MALLGRSRLNWARGVVADAAHHDATTVRQACAVLVRRGDKDEQTEADQLQRMMQPDVSIPSCGQQIAGAPRDQMDASEQLLEPAPSASRPPLRRLLPADRHRRRRARRHLHLRGPARGLPALQMTPVARGIEPVRERTREARPRIAQGAELVRSEPRRVFRRLFGLIAMRRCRSPQDRLRSAPRPRRAGCFRSARGGDGC
jgi:hypothetical protein